MSVELDIRGINSLGNLLARLPLGEQAKAVAQRLGTWQTRAHGSIEAKMEKPFPGNVSDLADDALSDSFSHWNSELMRLHQLTGLLEGQRKILELNVKKARAQARSAIRKEYETALQAAADGTAAKPTKPLAGEINDRAEEDAQVLEAESALVTLDVILESVRAYREGCVVATSALSREISFRQAQFSARVRA